MIRRMAVGGLVVVILGSGLELAHSAYVIKLKNGNEYITDRYWYAGAQVLFDTYGGVFGVEKAFISRIAKSEQISRALTASEREQIRTPLETPDPQIKISTDPKLVPEAKAEKKRADDDQVVSEFTRLKEKSKEVAGMLTSEIRDLLNQITSFRNKISRDSKLFFEYGNELNDASELSAAVEAALQSRTQ